MANTLLNKKTELNNLAKDYSINVCSNSYILNYNASLIEVPYDKHTTQQNISQYLNIDIENRIDNFQTNYKIRNEFNFTYTYYQSNYNIKDNSLIISNLAHDEKNIEPNSYLLFYNTFCGLKQLSYHYKEGNGLYYDSDNHILTMSIDNNTIKEINKKLFFDTNSIPISSLENYGISYIDNKYLNVNNGILSIDLSYIENLISYKYKIKNLFQSLTNIYNSLSYYNSIYDTKNDSIDVFRKSFDKVTNSISNNIIDSEISYSKINSLYFPLSEIKYIDNYYFSNGMIDSKYKQYITLDENNSYIIYCKDIEKINILSYISNDFINYPNSFDINKIKDIESNILNIGLVDKFNITSDTNLLEYNSENKQETVDNNNLYSYIYIDETNNYNKFIIKANIVNSNNLILNDKYYKIINTGFEYNSPDSDKKLFKQLGIIVNSKISLPEIKKNILKYSKVGDSIKYDYTVQNINCKYENKNIKILYDTRNITYCTYNINEIPYNDDVYYFLSNANIDNDHNINESMVSLLKNFDISFDNKLKYLFYGYSWNMKNSHIFNKKYYGIWNDLPTYYISNNLMSLLVNENAMSILPSILPLNNFLELYTKNFNEIEFDKDNYSPVTLYLYKIYKLENNFKFCKVKDINSNDVTINI